ncbi:MAG: hypothetical protein ACD_11C00054G0005 [uncultured bacterium]|nr:MAG: hypothetical protein ACD_11C00054G0005 [uncultured bacterium]HBR71989.1 hypothetical protein [Candidatus Moranbacteria bacterium]
MKTKIVILSLLLFFIFGGNIFAAEQAVVAPASGTIFANPLAYDSIEEFLLHFLSVIQQIIAILSLIFVVIGAVMYVISAGNSGMVEKAKSTITYSLIGLALGIAAPSFLKEISTILGWTGATSEQVERALTLTQIAMRVLNFLMSAVGILAVLMLVLGGAMYLSSAGDEDRIDMGKKIVKNSLLGIVISFSALILVRQIAIFFAN